MHVYILFAHPSKASFTWEVLNALTRGLEAAGHSFEVGDLYEMGFQSDVEHLQETGIAASMRRVMLDDRLLGIGVRKAEMVILGGMVAQEETIRRQNLARAYELGRTF